MCIAKMIATTFVLLLRIKLEYLRNSFDCYLGISENIFVSTKWLMVILLVVLCITTNKMWVIFCKLDSRVQTIIWTYFQTTNAFLHHTKRYAKCICEIICIENITADRQKLYTHNLRLLTHTRILINKQQMFCAYNKNNCRRKCDWVLYLLRYWQIMYT